MVWMALSEIVSLSHRQIGWQHHELSQLLSDFKFASPSVTQQLFGFQTQALLLVNGPYDHGWRRIETSPSVRLVSYFCASHALGNTDLRNSSSPVRLSQSVLESLQTSTEVQKSTGS